MTEQAYIGFGSNLGDSHAILKAVVDEMDSRAGVKIDTASSLYISKPVDVPDEQPDYYNCVISVHTSLAPESLLKYLQGLEDRHGRVRGSQRNLARTLDLDLLMMENRMINTKELVLPHPRIAERAFVLYPLHEIAPSLDIPGFGRVSELINNVMDQEITRL